MGLYMRRESSFWWMRVNGRCLSTKIPHTGATLEDTKELKRKALRIFHAAAVRTAEQAYGLAEPTISAWTFSDLVTWYLAHRVRGRPGAERSTEIAERFRADFATRRLVDITRQRVEEWITRRATTPRQRNRVTLPPPAASTINREVAELKLMLRAAAELGQLPASPIAGMPLLRTVPVKRRVLARDEEARLLTELTPADRALLLTGLDTLVRLGDLLDLQWADVDLEQCTATIRDPKDPTQGSSYVADLSSRVVAALMWLTQNGPYVFWHRRTAKLQRDWRGSVRHALLRACRRADVPYGRAVGGLTWHWATRRTGATRMIQAGIDIKTVQDIGHWRSPDVVLGIYTESQRQTRRKAVEVIGRKAR